MMSGIGRSNDNATSIVSVMMTLSIAFHSCNDGDEDRMTPVFSSTLYAALSGSHCLAWDADHKWMGMSIQQSTSSLYFDFNR